VIKRYLHKLKQFYAGSGLETFGAKSVEICLMQTIYNPTALKTVRIKTWQMKKFV